MKENIIQDKINQWGGKYIFIPDDEGVKTVTRGIAYALLEGVQHMDLSDKETWNEAGTQFIVAGQFISDVYIKGGFTKKQYSIRARLCNILSPVTKDLSAFEKPTEDDLECLKIELTNIVMGKVQTGIFDLKNNLLANILFSTRFKPIFLMAIDYAVFNESYKPL